MLLLRTLGLLLAVGVAPAMAFDLDAPRADLRTARGVLVVGDLATGDVGLTNYPSLCQTDGRLFMFANAELTEDTEYGFYWRVRREPGNVLTATVEAGRSASDQDWRKHAIARLEGASECQFYVEWFGADVIEVSTINGFRSATELLASAAE